MAIKSVSMESLSEDMFHDGCPEELKQSLVAASANDTDIAVVLKHLPMKVSFLQFKCLQHSNSN